MQFTQESKSQLAKLMATENIRVEHANVQTAMFNLETRTLTLPIWKDMSGELYDLLTGHEVGHALETPTEGWHNAVIGSGKYNKNFKHFLNVVEDSRIEKKMKRRYPGLRPSFVKAYVQLIERDFFGIKGRDLNSMSFIDRLNPYTKSGSSLNISFTDEEQKMVSDVESCETWNDVLRVTETIYGYSKEEQQQKIELSAVNALSDSEDSDSEDMEDYDFDSDGSEESEFDSDDSDFGEETESEDSNDSDETEETGTNNRIERFKESQTTSANDFQPVCETDEAFRKNENKLLDEKSKPYVYISLPKPIMSEILTPYKRVHELMEDYWFNQRMVSKEVPQNLYNDFKQKNERYISLLAKEFEMRKAASKFSKQKVSETGDIDVSRIYKYQVDDNIFRKISRIPKGKSHGLVLLFDRSGSMQYNLTGTIEQFLILSMFCRKVNIPFVVYGFGNSDGGFKLDHERYSQNSFTQNVGELCMPNVYLREYLNSKMSASEYTRCVKNLICLAESYAPKGHRILYTPYSEGLSNTPMIESIVALKPLTEEFRKNNNLDIVNMVLLHDGDSDSLNSYYANNEYYHKSFHVSSSNVVLRDDKNKFQAQLKNLDYDCGLREGVFNWYQKTTDTKIIGFFITSGNNSQMKQSVLRRYHDKDGKTIYDMAEKFERYQQNYQQDIMARELTKAMKEARFLESNNRGYKKFFLIPGGSDLDVENETLQIEGNITPLKLKNAFIKMNKKRQISRVLVNRFIGEIAV
jgi:hypothetical protein